MAPLTPTLDHAVVNARDQLDAAADIWRRLGFTLTPRGYHTLGSMNHLAMFGTDYLELIAAPAGDTRRPELLEAPIGLNGLVFGSEDAEATYAALIARGVPAHPPQRFSRPVVVAAARPAHAEASSQAAGGARDAVFRTVRLPPDWGVSGRLYFCQHHTRELVWQEPWRRHANGVVGIAGAVFAAADPSDLCGRFGRLFGDDAVSDLPEGPGLCMGLSTCTVLTPAALAARYGGAVPDAAGRTAYMAALVLRTRSLERAAAALDAGRIAGVRHEPDRIVVPASSAFGVTVEFRA